MIMKNTTITDIIDKETKVMLDWLKMLQGINNIICLGTIITSTDAHDNTRYWRVMKENRTSYKLQELTLHRYVTYLNDDNNLVNVCLPNYSSESGQKMHLKKITVWGGVKNDGVQWSKWKPLLIFDVVHKDL